MMTHAENSSPQNVSPLHPVIAIVLDVILVSVFAIIGRTSHALDITAGDIFRVATPFALALLVASVMTGFWRTWDRIWPTGVIVWLVTVLLGVALRILVFGDSSHWSFVVVTTVALGVLLLGRRGISQVISSRGTRSVASAKAPTNTEHSVG